MMRWRYCWFLWFERYEIIMVHALSHLSLFFEGINLFYSEGLHVISKSPNQVALLRKTNVKWQPPPIGVYKLNW